MIELVEIRQENPQKIGYLKRYWKDAKRGLDNTGKNYACVRHILQNVGDSQISTQGLGKTLTILTELGVLNIHSQRSNATIYDLTTYRPDRLTAVGNYIEDD